MTRSNPAQVENAGASRNDARWRRRRMVRYCMVAVSAGFAALLNGATAPSNNLGSMQPYAIVSSTYTNTSAGTTVTGGVCFTTGPAVNPVVNGPFGACPAAAGVDQTSALAELNTQPCTTIGSGPLEGISIGGGVPGSFPPGCYVRAGALDISANGIVTLTGPGVYVFRSSGGALTTGANSQIVLSGACANNVFWAPVGATTLGATSSFVGNILDAAGITIGLNANLNGRALAFGGTVSTAANTITIPADCPPIQCPVITVDQGTLPNGTVGAAYSQTLTASGGAAPYTFTVTGGALPPGLTLAASGLLSGTPTTAGTFTFTVRGTDVNGCFAERTIPLVVTTAVPTLPQAVALLLGLGLTAVGYLRLRRRTRSN